MPHVVAPEVMRVPALFLDRDGVVNHDIGYVHEVAKFAFVPEIFELCRSARRAGYGRIVIVTNQAGIGRGLFAEGDYQALTRHIVGAFAREAVAVDAIYHSPWHPEADRPEYRRAHDWRKPAPGMILAAIDALAIDAAASVLIGDRATDIAAARAAGVGTTVMIGDKDPEAAATMRLPDMAAVLAWMRARSP
jgi:D-glycero-D-manno-heptose 1,7-bisphosphate phosphatase